MESINSLSAKVRRARFTTEMTDDSWARAVSDHEEMIDALEKRDGIRLEQVIIRHVEAKGTTILGVIKNEYAPQS
jgi:FCD domain.